MLANIIGWVIVVLISIIGWIFNSRQSNKAIVAAAVQNKDAVKKAAEDAALAATKEFTHVKDTVDSVKKEIDSLPCTKDSNYMIQSGRLIQQVIDLQSGQNKIEEKIDKFMEVVLKAGLVKNNGCQS